MGRQFKKPFQDSTEQRLAMMAEQDTAQEPSVHLPEEAQISQEIYRPNMPFAGMSRSFERSMPGQAGSPLIRLPLTSERVSLPEGSFPRLGPARNLPDMPRISLANPGASLPSPYNKKSGKGRARGKKRRFPIWARVIVSILIVLLLLMGGGYWYYQVNFASAVTSMTGKGFNRVAGEEDPNAGKTGSSILNWGRVNILLLGSDTDEKSNWGGNAFLAQTVIVLTLDTATHDVGLLSLPRDFWISIPGYGSDKLDTAFSHGGSLSNNMSGVSKVVQTLDVDFGIPINFYAWVGLDGFIKVIDTVGGIDVDVMHPIVDDTYPDDIGTHKQAQNNFKRLYIPDGLQHLDGPTALEYVRSRHSTTDFNRSARQQDVLGALKLKLEKPDIFGKLPQIVKNLEGSVYTQLDVGQLLDLANFARGVEPKKIRHLTLGPPYSHGGTIQTQSGPQSVVFPYCNMVVPAINQFLYIHTGKCNIGYSSINNTPQAISQVATVPQATIIPAQTGAQPAQGLHGLSEAVSNASGLRALLDLVALVVLDSPQL